MRLSARAGTFLVPALLACAMLVLSVRLGPDASWDLRNYHLYDAFAALKKPAFRDLVPAQMQTYHPPMADIPSLWLRFRLNQYPRLLDALLAVPSAVAVLLAWCIGRRVLPGDSAAARLSLLLAILFGVSGAAGLPTTGSSMSEMPAASFALGGLLLLLNVKPVRMQPGRLLLAGLLFGVAAALKLTLMTLVLGGLVATLTCLPGPPMARLGRTACVAVGVAAGAMLVGGVWWWHLASLTGNPVFPYFNDVFRSTLYPPQSLSDARFLPRCTLQMLFYPFSWAFSRSVAASELPVRDPRLAVAFVAVLFCFLLAALQTGTEWIGRRPALLLAFCVTDFVLWEAQFSVLRYLAPIELLSGLPVLLALSPLRAISAWLPPAILATLLLGCASLTIYPDWGRVPQARTAASVVVPLLPSDAMVLLLGGDALSYVAAFAPPSTRFIGVDNNLVHPGQDSLLERRIEQAVRRHPGPIYGLEMTSTAGTAGVLHFYGLHRAGCRPVVTNLEQDGPRLCLLLR